TSTCGRGWTGAPPYRHRTCSAEGEGLVVAHRPGELEIEPLQQLGEQCRRFQTGQRCAQAVVHAHAEGEVAARRTREVQVVRRVVGVGVVVGRGDHGVHDLPGLHRDAARQLRVLRCVPGHELYGRHEADQLLDGAV